MDLGIILASFLAPFGIHFRYFFGIDFWMPFWMPFFRVLGENGRQKAPNYIRGGRHLASQASPKTLQKRIRDATSIFHRFSIEFGSHFGDIFMVLAPFFHNFRRQHRQFLPASRIQTFCFQFASVFGGRRWRSASTMTFEVPLCIHFRLFSKKNRASCSRTSRLQQKRGSRRFRHPKINDLSIHFS